MSYSGHAAYKFDAKLEDYVDATSYVQALFQIARSLNPSRVESWNQRKEDIWREIALAEPQLQPLYAANDNLIESLQFDKYAQNPPEVPDALQKLCKNKVLSSNVEKLLFAKRDGTFSRRRECMRLSSSPSEFAFIDNTSGLMNTKAYSVTESQIPEPLQNEFSGCNLCASALPPTVPVQIVYHELPGPDWIRLLVISPGELEDPLNCRLRCFQLSTVAAKYEALSYSWHERTPQRLGGGRYEISVNCATIEVQPNLWYALRRVRLQRQARTLWIDKLCINQSDNVEKSQQINMMPSIYGQSSNTIVWLGESSAKDIEHSLDMLCGILKSWDSDCNATYHVSGITKNSGFPSLFDSETRGSHLRTYLESVGRLFAVNWFRRRWIIQEVTVSRSATVMWSNYTIAWHWVGLVAAILRTNYNKQLPYGTSTGIFNAYLIFRLCRHGNLERVHLSFVELLRLASMFQTSDPRDAIFALLGIHTSDHDPQKAPLLTSNYDMDERELNLMLIERLLELPKPLSFLSSVHPDSEDRLLHNSETKPLPSWLPQWTSPSIASILTPWTLDENFNASKGLDFERIRPSSREILAVSGIEVSIVLCSSTVIGWNKNIYQAIEEVVANLHIDLSWPALFQLLCRTLTAGRNQYGGLESDGNVPLQHFIAFCAKDPRYEYERKRYLKSRQVQNFFSEAKKMHKDGNDVDFFRIAEQVCIGRVLFVTTSGHVGLGPAGTAAGDLLCVLAGSTLPVVLRAEQSRYRFVGDCFVDDIIGGEVVSAMRKGEGHFGPLGKISALPSLDSFEASHSTRIQKVCRGFMADVLSMAKRKYTRLEKTTFEII